MDPVPVSSPIPTDEHLSSLIDFLQMVQQQPDWIPLLVILAVIALIAAVFVPLLRPLRQSTLDLEDELTALTDENQALASTHAELVAQTEDLQQQVATLASQQLSPRLDSAQSQLDGKSGTVALGEKELTALWADNAAEFAACLELWLELEADRAKEIQTDETKSDLMSRMALVRANLRSDTDHPQGGQ